MGLVLVILAFAAITHAAEITVVNADFAAQSRDFFGSQAFAAELQSAYRAHEGGLVVLDDGRSLLSLDDAARLNADNSFFSFVDWSKLGDDSAEFDFIRRRIDGLAGTHDKWRGRLSGFEP